MGPRRSSPKGRCRVAEKVVLGLSGGVDSAVAARLLVEAGYTVYGHWLDIGLGGREAAAEVAESLGIPFSAGDIRQELETEVMAPFQRDYLAGRTPLPCARCNPTVKFPALFRRAEEVGAQFVATGHYARIRQTEHGPALCRGAHTNDQAYMLARLPGQWLGRLLFPIGGYEKTQVRELARGYGIPVADKPDSMEICFIPQGDYAAWLDQRGQVPPPGDFVDRDGNVLGRHLGIHHYTIGQRRGLGIPAAHRLFVSAIRPEENQVVLSDGTDLMADAVWGGGAEHPGTLGRGSRGDGPPAPLEDGDAGCVLPGGQRGTPGAEDPRPRPHAGAAGGAVRWRDCVGELVDHERPSRVTRGG